MNQKERHDLVLEYLKGEAASDAQIIDMLLLLLDDWEVRAAVMKSVDRRRSIPGGQDQKSENLPHAVNQ